VKIIGTSLGLQIARELTELTGETPSRLFTWAGQQKILPPPFGSRQTFYSHLSWRWEPNTQSTSTKNCHLGSHPFCCELRFRAVSLWTQFSRDLKRREKRQVIIFFGYEVCSQLLHFRVYRGPAYRLVDGMLICEELPLPAVTAFVAECASMVGLPLKRVLFTQPVKNLPEPQGNQVGYLSLESGLARVAEKNEVEVPNEVLYGFANLPGKTLQPFSTVQGDHPFIEWCATTNAKALKDRLSALVKQHNRLNAMPAITLGRKTFEALLNRSRVTSEIEESEVHYGPQEKTEFEKRRSKHDYVLNPWELKNPKFYNKKSEDFYSCPGDRSPKAGRRHGDNGDSDKAS